MRQLHLNSMLGSVGLGNWLHPLAEPERLSDFSYLVELAKTAERGCMDAIFCADLNTSSRLSRGPVFGYEPLTAYAALASATTHIGLIVTLSTTYQEPNNIARRLATLDHISGGRAGWNIVTGLVDEVSRQYGSAPHPAAAERYRRAQEFVDVVTALWDSWSDDAMTIRPDGTVQVDSSAVSPIAHKGEFFAVRGPSDVPKPPQGRPVLAQAGSSPRGQAFAARNGEVIFTAQPTFQRSLAFRRSILAQAAQFGRPADSIRVMPGLIAVIAATTKEARELKASLDAVNNEKVRQRVLSDLLQIDLAALPQDEPIPLGLLADTDAGQLFSRVALYNELITEKRLTPREVVSEPTHLSFVGTPDEMADLMQEWVLGEACDGFTLFWPYLPGALETFVNEVVPRLQRRGLFRMSYGEPTLRGHYRLQRG